MIKCIVCDSQVKVVLKFSARANLYNTNQSYDYWFCKDCVVLFRDPLLKIKINSYDANYYSFKKITKNECIRNYFLSILFNIFYYTGIDLKKDEYILYKIFKKLKIKKSAKILDVGCGNGSFILRLRAFGYKNIFGYDPNFKENFTKLKIFKNNFNNLEEPGRYDLINAHHVIEHVDNPLDFLKKIKHNLSLKGIALVTFPKYGRIVEIDNEYSYLVQAPDHIALYSEKSFEKLCQKAKLKVISNIIDSSGTFNWLAMGALWKKGIYAKSFHKNLLSNFNNNEIYNLKKNTQDIINKNQGSNLLYLLKNN